jgi:mitogen-activated protein kinase 1/3
VAIKKFSGIYKDPILCKRVMREVEILYSLNNPCIVRPLEVILRQQTGDIYLVMEYAQTDLQKIFKSPIHLEENQVQFLLYKILLAVNYLHSGGIVHRDIKPGNILINADCSLKICDFSLSRSMEGLSSRKFDYDMALRHNPDFCISSDSSIPEADSSISLKQEDLDIEEETVKNMTSQYEFSVGMDHKVAKKQAQIEISKKERHIQIKEKRQDERQILLRQCKESCQMMKRELTGHVGTRWYRAPEIILLEKVYSTSCDIWSVGCVFAELLQLLKKNITDYHKRQALFQGTSCFPLSPSKNPVVSIAGMPVSPGDQINVILATFGTPCENKMSFITDAKAKNYIGEFPKHTKQDLSYIFPNENNTDALDLLSRMLDFNPYFRITAKEALRHKYFAKIRNKQLEAELSKSITLISDSNIDSDNLPSLVTSVLSKAGTC